ncbi:MAG: GNAT family N-acetyltransferase [Gracilimonas sp.]|nr:GNAT family N-acetyltransferase [Gracilimonas sp.]
MEAHLLLEARLPMLGSATDFTYKWCVNMGLERDDAARMALATDEVLTDILLHGYKNESGYIEIWFQYTFSEIEIAIQEKGEPFDPEKYRYDPEKAIKDHDFEGAALMTIRKMTDQFLFLNRGKDGKEFRLVKQFTSSHIKDMLPEHLDPEDLDEPEPDCDYLLTPATSEDAEDIAKLIYRSYSYTYSKEDLYFPKRIETAIKHEYKFGTIVRTESGGPAGYFAVIKSTDSMIGEVGEAVVSPNHRSRGLMKKMMNELIKMSNQRGLKGLFGMASTFHIISQKVNDKFGFKSTALILAKSPQKLYKGMTSETSEIVSVVMDFLPLTKLWKKPVILPEVYKDILSEVYAQFTKQNQTISSADPAASGTDQTDLGLTINYETQNVLITVKDYGKTFETSCLRLFRSIEELNLNAIYIDLPLNDHRINNAIKWLKEQEFIFSGLMPLFHHENDFMRMQKIMAETDFDKIKTYTDIAGKLKEIIKQEYNAIPKK